MIRIGILTVSDRSARGERPDLSGPALAQAVTERLAGAEVVIAEVVPDERAAISAWLVRAADELRLDLVLTTGGTGFAPRDITPEATRAVIERDAPGLAEAIARGQSARDAARHAQPRGRRHPRPHADRESAGQPQRRGRKPRHDPAGSPARRSSFCREAPEAEKHHGVTKDE